MNLIQFSIKNAVTVIVSVLIILLFGLLALDKLPYQLTPSVTKPEIKVTTFWPGATPYEIEQDIIEEQEKVLKSLNNLLTYESSSKDNMGEITWGSIPKRFFSMSPISSTKSQAILRMSNSRLSKPRKPAP